MEEIYEMLERSYERRTEFMITPREFMSAGRSL